MYAEERKNKIIRLLEKNGRVDACELSKSLNTSRETIRRDLKDLSERGLLVKTHGGAIAAENSSVWQNIPISHRESKNAQIKYDICAFALQYIHDSDQIFLDNSSTVANLIKCIPKSLHITLITNSIKILLEISKYSSTNWITLHTGGAFVPNTLSTNGYLAMNNLNIFRPTKAFLSSHGIDKDLKVTDSYLDDVELKDFIIKSAKETFLLVDHSKLNRSGVVQIVDVNKLDHVITDSKADPVFLESLRKEGIDVLIAPPTKSTNIRSDA